ncbi:MAG TPA: hypothetical protein VES92_05605 [Nitrospiraceae bacterium]|nr:hypothetical protein [Nitrospiraceae bacterium]
MVSLLVVRDVGSKSVQPSFELPPIGEDIGRAGLISAIRFYAQWVPQHSFLLDHNGFDESISIEEHFIDANDPHHTILVLLMK